MFRDRKASFSFDELALEFSQSAVKVSADIELTAIEHNFLYMPFMHSESLIIHEDAMALFKKNGIESSIKFEKKHKEIIERFGRYPHRNNILGRLSTDEELEFLKLPNSGF